MSFLISGTRTLSREALVASAARAAAGMAALGIGEDDAVALVLRNDFVFFEAAQAAALIGAYAVPVNWHFTAQEAGYIIRDCGAKLVVLHADLLERVTAAVPGGIPMLVAATPAEIAAAYAIPPERCAVPAEHQAWDAWLARQALWTAPAKPMRANIIYTSGTTGQPKGVRRAPATARETQQRLARTMAQVFGIRAGETIRAGITGPLYHAAPNAFARACLREAECILLQPRFDAKELLQLIERHRLTHMHMVPTMFVRLLKLPAAVKRRYDLSSLRFVVHGAAPCPPAVKREMIAWWGPVINEYYGGTETGGAVFHTAAEALEKPGTVGRPIEGAAVKIIDGAGRALGIGEVGEIYLRVADNPDFTYQGLPEQRREIERDGFITLGDIGYLDKDGYLFLCDRARDMVISGGVNIYPAEIEQVLVTMRGVRDCAVFGIPDEEYGESLCAHIEVEEGAMLSADEVKTFLRRHLAGYKVPKRIEFCSALPREDSGKIYKRQLRAPYWERTGRQI
ncbi:MAG TPA: acyl-CoA synthetase [Stellaceae bacterium]|nr:acyl-CoA synthetase [Stellaceae bacterium]